MSQWATLQLLRQDYVFVFIFVLFSFSLKFGFVARAEDVRGQKDKEIRMHEVKCTKNQKKLKKEKALQSILKGVHGLISIIDSA